MREIKKWLQVRYDVLKKHHDQADEFYKERSENNKGDTEYYKNVRDDAKVKLKFMQELIDEV